MFIPLGTDLRLRRTPLVTQWLIIANLVVYLVGLVAQTFEWFDKETVIAAGHFDPQRFRVWQLFTYQFLHDPYDVLHVGFNMLFLWVFGCPLEDRLGRGWFLAYYLVGGAVAGIGHMLASAAPVIGASGSVAAVSGGFLALFPRSRIRVLLFFILIGVYAIPSLWFIGAYFIIDVLNQAGALIGRADSGVAYMAHLAGYVGGFSLCLALLAFRIIPRGEWDVLRLFKQARRRAAFRAAASRHAAAPWSPATKEAARRPAKAPPGDDLPAEQRRVARLRASVAEHVAAHQPGRAITAYRELVATGDVAPFPPGIQLDLGNALYASQEYDLAARVYRALLERHPTGGSANEVRLMLGALCARQLARPDEARRLIQQARAGLLDEAQRDLADAILAELDA